MIYLTKRWMVVFSVKWEQVRVQYPGQWVLVEAISAHSENSIRHIDEMAVISSFIDSTLAWKDYKKLHLADRSREYYIFHTDHKEIEVEEQRFIGVRRRIQ